MGSKSPLALLEQNLVRVGGQSHGHASGEDRKLMQTYK